MKKIKTKISYRSIKRILDSIDFIDAKKILLIYKKEEGVQTTYIYDFLTWLYSTRAVTHVDKIAISIVAMQNVLRKESIPYKFWVDLNKLVINENYTRQRDILRAYKKIDFDVLNKFGG